MDAVRRRWLWRNAILGAAVINLVINAVAVALGAVVTPFIALAAMND